MLKSKLIIFLLLLVSNILGQGSNKTVVDKDIELIQLQDSVFIHTTWHESDNFGRFPSNGLLIIKNGDALLVDTPMDNEKTERLCDYIKHTFNAEPSHLIIGHYHDDCLGGLPYLQSIGVKSIAHTQTKAKCQTLGLALPSAAFSDSLNLNFNDIPVSCRFFGAGHSFDNITVWLADQQILFGGCLVKSSASSHLGNLSDAVVEDWENTITKIITTYPEVSTVIPGHGNAGGKELLHHTITLVQKQLQQCQTNQ